MKTPGSTPVSAMRIRSPRTAPPVYGDVGSTATTPTFFSRPRRVRTRRLMRELLPTPGGPVNPTTWARPVCGWIRATASVASGSSSSIREMSFPAARLSPFRRESTRPGTGSRGRDDGLRRPPEPGLDDPHAGIAPRAGDDLGPTVVAVESPFRHQDADLLRDRTTSIEERFLVGAEDFAHHVADLAERRLRPDRVKEERHRIVVRFARLPEAVERGGVLLRVPRPANLVETGRLGLERRLRNSKDLELRLFVHDEVIDADDHPLAVLDLPLIPVCGIRNLLLEEPFPDRRDDAAEPLDPVEISVGLFLEFVRQGLEEIRAADRTVGVRDDSLFGLDLLQPEGEAGGRFVRNLVRFR